MTKQSVLAILLIRGSEFTVIGLVSDSGTHINAIRVKVILVILTITHYFHSFIY